MTKFYTALKLYLCGKTLAYTEQQGVLYDRGIAKGTRGPLCHNDVNL